MKKTILTLAAIAAAASTASAIVELKVVDVITQTGSTEPFPPTNVAPSTGDIAQYELELKDTVTNVTSTSYLQVGLVLGSFGNLTEHRISTGQGNPENVGISIGGTPSGFDATYLFSFFSDAGFSTPAPIEDFSMEVADIDEVEGVVVNTGKFSSTINFGSPTNLVATPLVGSDIAVTNDVGPNADKSNPIAAASFDSLPGITTFEVRLSGRGNSPREFQFDFTPEIVPEPSAYALLTGLVALGFITTRRRAK